MDYSKVVTKEDVELETLKKFLDNKDILFDAALTDPNTNEPTDIRYDGTNYQITEGDQKTLQERRSITSKGTPCLTFKSVSNIADRLLRRALEKKSLRSDINTVLLVDVMSNGGRNWEDLEREVASWAKDNLVLCSCWRDIYLVYRGRNVKVLFIK